jgi:transcriptional regulator with XRE-family HTH domain
MLKTLYSRHNEVLLELLRSSRRAVRMRQSDLASRLGSDQATVSRVERGVRRLDVIELRAWLEAMEVDFIAFVQNLDSRLQGAGAHRSVVAELERLGASGDPRRRRSGTKL